MAMLDAFLGFSVAQALTATAVSTNIVDLADERDMGIGAAELTVAIWCTTTFVSAGSSTLQTAPDSSGSPGTYVTIAQSQRVLKANMVAGAKLAEIRIPATIPQTIAMQGRFLRLNYTVGTADFSAGNLSAYIVGAHDNVAPYPAGVVVAN